MNSSFLRSRSPPPVKYESHRQIYNERQSIYHVHKSPSTSRHVDTWIISAGPQITNNLLEQMLAKLIFLTTIDATKRFMV